MVKISSKQFNIQRLDHDQAIIALGSNLGHRRLTPNATLCQAISAIRRAGVEIVARSSSFATPAFPKGNGPDFANAVILVRFKGESQGLLQNLHSVEQQFRRVRKNRWGARTLDLDLIAHGDRVLPDIQGQTKWVDLELADQLKLTPDQLILPHPRLQDRSFVLGPLMQLLPEWQHPVTGQSVRKMFGQLSLSVRTSLKPIK